MIPVPGKKTRALILVMVALTLVTVLFASWFYGNKNSAADPRVVPARELYQGYNALATSNDFTGVMQLLDTVESIYAGHNHYRNSFETGVLENNRAAVYLTLALSYDSIGSAFHHLGKDSLVSLGGIHANRSLSIYKSWDQKYSGLDEAEIKEKIRAGFFQGLELATDRQKEGYLDNRVSEILDALEETPRRMSVSYTNLGMMYRVREDYESAALSYKEAMDLWEDNLTAENNLNLLLNRPLEKRNMIQKMFPAPRD